jgi:hypothetical protein
MTEAGAAPATASGPSAVKRSWLRFGSFAAFVGAVATLAAAVAGGITESTGIATISAVAATVVAYGLVPLVVTLAMRQSGLSSWWAVAAGLLAAGTWSAAGVLFAAPALMVNAPSVIDAFVSSAPSASALWIVVASVEVVRAGMHRWSLIVVAAFVAVLIVGSLLIELSGFDIRKVLVPLGWTVWMIDVGRAQRGRMSPAAAPPPLPAADATACANCGAPRRKDGLAFCSDCGLPYGAQRQ